MTSVPPPPPTPPPTGPENLPPPQAYAALPQQYPTQPQYQKTNTLALISMIASIAGAFIFPIVGSVAGIIMGHIARKQIRQTGENGDGMALAGLIVGYVFLVIWLAFFVAWIVIWVALIASTSSYGV